MNTVNSRSFLNIEREAFQDASDLVFNDCVFEHCNSLRTDNQLTYTNLIFNNCTFNQCNLGHSKLNVLLQNIQFFNVSQLLAHIEYAHIKDVSINNLKTTGRLGNGMMYISGCFLDNFQLIGKIGLIKLNILPLLMTEPSERDSYLALIKEHLSKVRVALDVRHADFTSSISLGVVPGEKVLFNPNEGAVLHRNDLEGLELNEFASEESHLRSDIYNFRKFSPFESTVLLAAGNQKPKEKALDLKFLEYLFRRNLVRSAEPSHNNV